MAVTPFKSSDNFNMAGFNEKITEADNTYVAKTGGSMTGALSMGNNKITDVASPTSAGDAANKEYVDGIGSEIKNKFNISNEIPVYVVTNGQIIGTGTVHNYISYSVIDIKNTTQGASIAQLYKSEQIQDEFLLRAAISPLEAIGLSLVSDKQHSYAEIGKYGYISVSEAVGERSIYVPFLCF